MSASASQASVLQALQKELLFLQGFRKLQVKYFYTGLPVIEKAFPQKTLPMGAIHDFSSFTMGDAAATDGFISGLLSRLLAPLSFQKNVLENEVQGVTNSSLSKITCVWVNGSFVFPPALRLFGILPENIVFVRAPKPKEALWLIEEALKCSSLMAVVGQLKELSFTESRRLQLIVERSGVTGFIHRCFPQKAHPVACVANWQITAASSISEGLPGVGRAVWNVELKKVRNGQPGRWIVEWRADHFRQIVTDPLMISEQYSKTAG